jgi:hypothetical protein
MENVSTSSQSFVDQRGAAFGRLAGRVLEALNEAVEYRKNKGETLTFLAEKIGCHRSSLTRALNGTSANLTLRTISDILWATRHEPQDFIAEPVEAICSNWNYFDQVDKNDSMRDLVFVYGTTNIKMREAENSEISASVFQKPEIEISVR